MKLLQFKSIVNNLKGDDKPIYINLTEPSVGQRAFIDVLSVYQGFDWEMNQIRIEPSKPLIRKFNDRDLPKPKIKNNMFNNYICTSCNTSVNKNDNYCSNCGQCIKGVKII